MVVRVQTMRVAALVLHLSLCNEQDDSQNGCFGVLGLHQDFWLQQSRFRSPILLFRLKKLGDAIFEQTHFCLSFLGRWGSYHVKFFFPIVFIVFIAVLFLLLRHLLLDSQEICLRDVFFLDVFPVFTGGGRRSPLLF